MAISHVTTLQPAYLLHARPFKDTSLIIDLFTQTHGRITAVAKGARRKSSPLKRALRPFSPLLVTYSGRTDLLNLNQAEQATFCFTLQGAALFSGFYLNELMIRLLPLQDAHTDLFIRYETTIKALASEKEIEPHLRQFEFQLLKELGYGFRLDHDFKNNPVLSQNFYQFDPKRGFIQAQHTTKQPFKGEHLLNFHQNQWHDSDTLIATKRLMRIALSALLGNRPLKTRQFFEKI